jgi:hypothetical protein
MKFTQHWSKPIKIYCGCIHFSKTSNLKDKVLSNKNGQNIGIFHMEEALVPQEYKMEVMGQQDYIFYGNYVSFCLSFFPMFFF